MCSQKIANISLETNAKYKILIEFLKEITYKINIADVWNLIVHKSSDFDLVSSMRISVYFSQSDG